MNIKPMVESIANNSSNLKVHHQYKPYIVTSLIQGLISNYNLIFEVVEGMDRTSLLDFGGGVGVGQLNYNQKPRPFSFEMCDLSNIKWRGNDENVLFTNVRNSLGYNTRLCDDVMKSNFKMEHRDYLYDCVVFHRFPILSEGKLSGAQVKKRLKPYVTDDCVFIYSNLSIYHEKNFPFFKSNPHNIIRLCKEEDIIIATF